MPMWSEMRVRQDVSYAKKISTPTSSQMAAPTEAATAVTDPLNDGANPVVFFDVSVGGHPLGRIKMELFANVVPKTTENFRCTAFLSSTYLIVAQAILHRAV